MDGAASGMVCLQPVFLWDLGDVSMKKSLLLFILLAGCPSMHCGADTKDREIQASEDVADDDWFEDLWLYYTLFGS